MIFKKEIDEIISYLSDQYELGYDVIEVRYPGHIRLTELVRLALQEELHKILSQYFNFVDCEMGATYLIFKLHYRMEDE